MAEALRLLDRLGGHGFSMRALAEALGVAPMTIYGYVPTKAQLLEEVVGSVIDGIGLPDAEAPRWQDELRRYALEAWDAQVPHPWIAAFLAEQRLIERPNQRIARIALVDLFKRAGADDSASREAVAVFFSYMIGSLVQVAPAVADHGPTARSRALFEHGLSIVIDGFESRFRRSD